MALADCLVYQDLQVKACKDHWVTRAGLVLQGQWGHQEKGFRDRRGNRGHKGSRGLEGYLEKVFLELKVIVAWLGRGA